MSLPLPPRSFSIELEDQAVEVDIGFHEFEVGHPQRVLVTIRVRIGLEQYPSDDQVSNGWDYDVLREIVLNVAASQRFDLQETFVTAIYSKVAALFGVLGVEVRSRKPDVYTGAASVGITLSSG